MSCKGGCQSQNTSPTEPIFLFHSLFCSNSVQSRPSSSSGSLHCGHSFPPMLQLLAGCHDLQCCSPPLSLSSSAICLSSSSRCCLWTLSFSLSFLKLRTPSASGMIYKCLKWLPLHLLLPNELVLRSLFSLCEGITVRKGKRESVNSFTK